MHKGIFLKKSRFWTIACFTLIVLSASGFSGNTAKAVTDEASVKVISPNGGEDWQAGKTYEIKWETKNINSVTNNNVIAMPLCAVDLYRSDLERPVKSLISNYSFGNYFWTVSSDLKAGQYKISVSCNEYGSSASYSDLSDSYFNIIPVEPPKLIDNGKCSDYDRSFYLSRFSEADTNSICVDPINFDWKAKGWPENPSGKRGDETIEGWKIRVKENTTVTDTCMHFYYEEGRFDYTTAKEICVDVVGFDWKAKGWPEHPSGKRGDETISGWIKRVKNHEVSPVVSSVSSELSECLADGTLLKQPGDSKVYVIKKCKKEWIQSEEEFVKNGYNWGNIKESVSVLGAYADYLEEQARIIRATDSGKVYKIIDGKKLLVPKEEYLENQGVKKEEIKATAPAAVNAYPSVNLIRTENSPEVYFVTDTGLKKHIPSPEAFASYGNKWEDIVSVSPEEIKSFSTANLLKDEKTNKVYKLEGSVKKWVKSPKAFNSRGFKWANVASANSVELNAYADGKPLE